MKFEHKDISIGELVENYVNNDEEGVIGFNGKLNIRPKYQREFIYKDKQKKAVIQSVMHDFPLGTIYWVENEDGNFELLDGQQRIMSICEYIEGKFSVKMDFSVGGEYVIQFNNLPKENKDQILGYKLNVHVCRGTEKERLDWFRTINIANEKLFDQELRNAVYTGKWLSDAKRYFSKTGCAAYNLGKDYVKGSPIRQDFLETAINWISKGEIEKYMSENQHSPNANELWLYFQNVINWVNVNLPNYRKEMKGVNWGFLYNNFKDVNHDSDFLEEEITRLMIDEDVTKKSGIYMYVFTKEEKHLNIRSFSNNAKRETYERQNGICAHCNKACELNNMEADHITPWHEGGKTKSENCQMLCLTCNRSKSGK